MKLSILLLLSSGAIVMTGCTTSQNDLLAGKPVPEAVILHPEKYTLRFVQATGTGLVFDPIEFEGKSSRFENTFSPEKNGTNGWRSYRCGEPQPPEENMLLSRIEHANPVYKELISLPVEMGKEFSSDNGSLTGKVWSEIDFTDSNPDQNAVMSFELKYDGRPIKLSEHHLKVGKWFCLGLGRSNRVEWILVKLYEPQK